jgi:hypothetical protein
LANCVQCLKKVKQQIWHCISHHAIQQLIRILGSHKIATYILHNSSLYAIDDVDSPPPKLRLQTVSGKNEIDIAKPPSVDQPLILNDNSSAVEISFLSGRCGQCVRPIKHLPDLHFFYNFNWITHILAKSIKWFVYSFKWYLGILKYNTFLCDMWKYTFNTIDLCMK